MPPPPPENFKIIHALILTHPWQALSQFFQQLALTTRPFHKWPWVLLKTRRGSILSFHQFCRASIRMFDIAFLLSPWIAIIPIYA